MQSILDLLRGHNYLAIAIVVIGWVTALLGPDSKFPITIPDIAGRDPKPLIAGLLGLAYGILVAHQGGATWLDALRDGLLAGVGTAGLFDVVVKFIFKGQVPVWLNIFALVPPQATKDANATRAACALAAEAKRNEIRNSKLPPANPPSVPPTVIGLMALALCACSWLTPRHVVDVAEIATCILANDQMKPIDIVVKCGAENEQQVIDILTAHRQAAQREHVAVCGPAADGGAP